MVKNFKKDRCINFNRL